mmetsp:Transcript_36988/g.64226  ORF Transcript_36988/g.64226 Transcript_36988/m.64226 type:complete len:80 (-) Transcript_36988:3-242(-)
MKNRTRSTAATLKLIEIRQENLFQLLRSFKRNKAQLLEKRKTKVYKIQAPSENTIQLQSYQHHYSVPYYLPVRFHALLV